ncbi:MAG TPA: S9 family peptidase [Phycisphaerae bacterium]|nr:S9 family peptidase [Phycisphaerae bacterium]
MKYPNACLRRLTFVAAFFIACLTSRSLAAQQVISDEPTIEPEKMPAEQLAELCLTSEHLAHVNYIGSAAISPAGTHIAFTRNIPRNPYEQPGRHDPDFEDGAPHTELYVRRVPDGEEVLYVGRHAPVSNVRWLPDGSALSFLAKRDPDKHTSLYVISLTGGEARRVLAHDTDIGDYSWSDDATRVAFVATDEKPKPRKDLEKKGFKAEVYEELHRLSRLWIAHVGDEPALEPDSVEIAGHVTDPQWSPDGAHIAVKISPSPLIDDVYMKQRVQVVEADTRKVVTKVPNPGKLGEVAWSPDGKHLAMISGEDINDPAEGRLMVVPAGGGELREILPGFEGHVKSIGWQDNDTVMYVADIGVETIFAKVDLTGGDPKTLIPKGGVVLGSVSVAKDGLAAAFIGQAIDHPPEVFFMKHGDENAARLTASNPWLATLRLARQEVIEYDARDGLTIQGILIHPLDEKPGTRYPLIVYVHGGPEAHESNGWITNYSRPGHLAAAKGFAVFYPNYRGSTGRGVEFSKLGQADYAGAEFDDLVDGVAHLVKKGLVDEKKVGVTGGSYGGYASAWCATKLTDHFAASVMFVGMSDLVSKFGTTDIPNEMFESHARKWPWEGNWDWFRERSPIFHVEKARTPLLILHGENDTRVHPSQSMELYRYLKTIGKAPVRLVLYPGEGHGNSKAASRLDYNLRMIGWFEHYLKGPCGVPPDAEIDYQLPEKKNEDATTKPAD